MIKMGEKKKAGNISQREKDIQYIMDTATKHGIELIYQKHPVFQGTDKLLLNHVDFNQLRKKSEEIYSNLLNNNIRGEKAKEYIEKELTDYVESGVFFNEKGNKIIARASFNEKPNLLEKIVSIFKPKSEGEKELNDIMGTIHNLGLLYQSKGYEKSVPQLNEQFKEAGKYLQKLGARGFVPAATSILEAYGQIDKRQADSWIKEYSKIHKYDIKEGKEHIARIKSGIEAYISPQKIAATILGAIGLIQIMFNAKITGAIIGSTETPVSTLIGALTLFLSLLWFFIISKKKL